MIESIGCDRLALYLLGFSQRIELVPEFSVQAEYLGIEVVNVGGIQAWYKSIPLAEFEGPEAESNLANIEWLTPRVVLHQSVVEQLAALGPFYPARFGTLFSGTNRILEFVENNEAALQEFFDSIEGNEEWSIKISVDITKATEQYKRLYEPPSQVDLPSGKNYLATRKLERERHPKVLQFLVNTTQSLWSKIDPFVSSTFDRPIIKLIESDKGNLNAGGESLQTVICNRAFLVNKMDVPEFCSVSQEWLKSNSHHTIFAIRTTGPWPAYSFCPALISPDSTSAEQKQQA